MFLFAFCHKGGVICVSEVIDISPAISIPTCPSSSPAFHVMYSAYKLNKHIHRGFDLSLPGWSSVFSAFFSLNLNFAMES